MTERERKVLRQGLRRRERNGRMKAISCLRLEVSDSVKMSEKAFKTHLHFTLALLQYAIFSSAVPFPPSTCYMQREGWNSHTLLLVEGTSPVYLSKKLLGREERKTW
jgi:hypothetical protein